MADRTRRTWVLGGGGARGAAQVGVLLGLFEAGVAPPERLVGASVGALNASLIAMRPSLAGALMLLQVWLSQPARDVFRLHPVSALRAGMQGALAALPGANVRGLIRHTAQLSGVSRFDELTVPLEVVATEFGRGERRVFDSGLLEPALLASTAIPGVFPAVTLEGEAYLDGGIVDNTPIDVAVAHRPREVVAIHLMGAGPGGPPANWLELMTRTLQLSLHHRMLSDFERLRRQSRITVLAPEIPIEGALSMDRAHVERIADQARRATLDWLARTRNPFRESRVVSLPLD